MGLDMYFHRRRTTYVMQHEDPTVQETCDGIAVPWELLGGVASHSNKDQIGYLRKVNAVHGWITREVAGGVDECQEIALSIEQVADLLEAVQDAHDYPDKIGDLEPTAGFFFGSEEKDEWYFEGLKQTKAILEWIMDDVARNAAKSDPHVYYDYTYQASW